MKYMFRIGTSIFCLRTGNKISVPYRSCTDNFLIGGLESHPHCNGKLWIMQKLRLDLARRIENSWIRSHDRGREVRHELLLLLSCFSPQPFFEVRSVEFSPILLLRDTPNNETKEILNRDQREEVTQFSLNISLLLNAGSSIF